MAGEPDKRLLSADGECRWRQAQRRVADGLFTKELHQQGLDVGVGLEDVVAGVFDENLRLVVELGDDFGLFLERGAPVEGAGDEVVDLALTNL